MIASQVSPLTLIDFLFCGPSPWRFILKKLKKVQLLYSKACLCPCVGEEVSVTSLNQVNTFLINVVYLQRITVHIFCNASEFGTKTFSKALSSQN